MENNQERINRLRKRMKQIADIAVDYIPEISGAAAGAAFGNPVVGAVIGTAAKRLLKRFMIARTKKLNFEETIQYNIERFGNATIAASGNLKNRKNPMTSAPIQQLHIPPTLCVPIYRNTSLQPKSLTTDKFRQLCSIGRYGFY